MIKEKFVIQNQLNEAFLVMNYADAPPSFEARPDRASLYDNEATAETILASAKDQGFNTSQLAIKKMTITYDVSTL